MSARKLKESTSKNNFNSFEEHVDTSHDDSHDSMDFHSVKKVEEGEGPWLVSYADMMTLLMGFFALIASFSKPDAGEFEKVKQAATEYFGGEYQEPYAKLKESIEQVVKKENLQSIVDVTSDPTGVSLNFTGAFFFDSGAFVVKENASAIVNKLIASIKEDKSKVKATIEGHTDSTPISHPIIASNWELSGLRAARVAKIFEANGFSKQQLTIIGWGETKPIANEHNADGSLNTLAQAKNRRVLIKISN